MKLTKEQKEKLDGYVKHMKENGDDRPSKEITTNIINIIGEMSKDGNHTVMMVGYGGKENYNV